MLAFPMSSASLEEMNDIFYNLFCNYRIFISKMKGIFESVTSIENIVVCFLTVQTEENNTFYLTKGQPQILFLLISTTSLVEEYYCMAGNKLRKWMLLVFISSLSTNVIINATLNSFVFIICCICLIFWSVLSSLSVILNVFLNCLYKSHQL